MKKYVAIILAILVFFSDQVIISYAAGGQDIPEYLNGKRKLLESGIDEATIQIMRMEDVIKFANTTCSGVESLYFAYVHNSKKNGSDVEIYLEEEYNTLMRQKARAAYASNEETYSWIKLTISSHHVENDRYIIMCRYNWLNQPILMCEDIVALTFDSRIVAQAGTGAAMFSYRDAEGKPHVDDYVDEVIYSGSGVYFEIDFPEIEDGEEITNIHGYLLTYADVNTLSGNDVSFNNWAYYAHMTNPFSFSYSVSFPIGGSFTITPSASFNIADVGLLTTHEVE